MPLRRAAVALLALLPLTGAAPASARPAEQARIVGGSPALVPYQVALLDNGGQFCGGSILDTTHVVTAAHCVTYDGTDTAEPASRFRVVAGTSDLADQTPPAESVNVAEVSVHPDYDANEQTRDVAVLGLASALTLDGVKKQSIAPASARTPAGTAATVSGWGSTGNQGDDRNQLRQATVHVLADEAPSCSPAYDFTTAIQPLVLCAADPATDSCQGDSGGPLVAGGALIGIVSFGEGCADPAYAGVYTEVADPSIHDFITGTLPEPLPSSPPLLTGTPQTGETLTCHPGDWTQSPTFRYAFFAVGAPVTYLRDFAESPTYVLLDGDANRTVGCVVEARSASGATRTETSNTVGPVSRAGGPPVTTVTVTVPAPVTDTTAPRSTVVARRCTRTTCRVDVQVEDPGYSTGVHHLELSYVTRYRVACRKRRRPTTCVRATAGSAQPVNLGRGLFAARLRSLHAGSSTVVTLVAVDNAGNRERSGVITVLRTTKPKKKTTT